MARPLRIQVEGVIYHVASRGNARSDIFETDADREMHLRLLEDVVGRFKWICHAYCLMTNHYHLLVETPEANLSRGMQRLNGVYSRRYNIVHRRCGHVFQGRFEAVLVEKESHLMEVCRYIVLNPVRAGIVKHPGDWLWSSFNATAGFKKAPAFLTTEWLLGQFGRSSRESRRAYVKFVLDGIGRKSPLDSAVGNLLLGGEGFVADMRKIIRDRDVGKEITKEQRHAGRPALSEIWRVREPADRKSRDEAIRFAYFKQGYFMREIGDFLGLHYSTVSRIVNRLKEAENARFKT